MNQRQPLHLSRAHTLQNTRLVLRRRGRGTPPRPRGWCRVRSCWALTERPVHFPKVWLAPTLGEPMHLFPEPKRCERGRCQCSVGRGECRCGGPAAVVWRKTGESHCWTFFDQWLAMAWIITMTLSMFATLSPECSKTTSRLWCTPRLQYTGHDIT